MPDDFSNFGKIKEPFFQTPENIADTKQSPQPKFGTGMRFIITKNKNNSWAGRSSCPGATQSDGPSVSLITESAVTADNPELPATPDLIFC